MPLQALSASLKVLSAAQCGLQAVAGLAVLGLLQALDLSSNAISDAGQVPKVLTGCQHLRSLSLQGNPICKQIGWDNNEEFYQAWDQARTGYPWIDACMMQLQKEVCAGWVSHRK